MNASLKTRKNVVTFFTYLVLILGSISMIFPFVWMVLTSFKTQAESMAIPPQILPSHWNLDSFVKALQSLPFTNLYLNTGLLILFRVIFAVVFSSMAGYAFAKLEFPCKKLLFGLVLWSLRSIGRTGYTKGDRTRVLAVSMFAGMCGVLVHCYFENIFEVPYMMAYFWSMAAAVMYLGYLSLIHISEPTRPY